MYSRDTSVRKKEQLSVEHRKGPSFSSTLLDEIYRSIDDGSARENRSNRARESAEKWIDKKKKNISPLKTELVKKENYVDNDALFFSSGSNSSDSNSSLFSEHESIPNTNPLPTTKTRSSCFLPPKPKPIRTKGEAKTDKEEDGAAKSMSRALKMYAHLKKMKQPISPGMKLTTFINSILPKSRRGGGGVTTSDKRSTRPTTCSSATSFTRSYMSQQTPSTKIEAEPFRTATFKLKPTKPISKIVEVQKPINIATRVVVEDTDGSEYSEDDLFEIDHLKLRFTGGGELPVYETTSSNQNRVATKGLKL